MDNKKFCLSLLKCETEDEVIKILKQNDFWDNRDCWIPYGNISNNRGIVSNQQSSSVAALVEKLVNSIDAILVSECIRLNIKPDSKDAPQTMTEAIERLLLIKGGSIANLDSRARTPFADRIQLVSTGGKKEPNYLIIDDGEGQNPSDFKNTFLSLLRENKTKIPFVQGKFNMGGTGVLQFSGKNSFQLIISRRQLDLPDSSKKWGFTLIRRITPMIGQPSSSYVYLAPNNEILSYDSDFLSIKPGKYPNVYEESLVAGTCIKIWNYKLQSILKTISTLNLRFELEKYLPDPALPIRIKERRLGWRANYYDTNMAGLLSIISDKPENIEPGFDTGDPSLDVPDTGKVKLRLVVFKETSTDERKPSGIFFIVNGQLHGERDKNYISRKTGLDYIATSLVILVDCTNLPPVVREDIFLASRDRMRQCDETKFMEDAIIEYLKDHPGLKELNARRRQERLSKVSDEETSKVIQNLVNSDPTLSNLFKSGEKVTIPIGDIPEQIPYEGKKFPTYFQLYKEPKNGLLKKCPKNRSAKIVFETDAVNDYFSRSDDPGRLTVLGIPSLKSLHLWNGKGTVRFSLPSSCLVGDKYKLESEVMDISRAVPFKSNFNIEVIEEMDTIAPPTPRPHSGKIDPPILYPVYRYEWEKYNFDEKTAIDIRRNEEVGLDIFINMDNIYLVNEIGKRRTMDPEKLRYLFKIGLYLLVVGMIFQLNSNNEKSEEKDEPDYESIKIAAKGLAVTLIPVLINLNK